MKVIEIEHLNYKIKDKDILKDINLSVNKGEYITILGSNGSGKSTLALLISGLIDVEPDRIKVANRVAILLENPDNQIIGTTVIDDVAFGLENQQMDREKMTIKIDKVLKEVGIFHLKYSDVQTLSGGEKQKLSFASLLVLEYEIYVLDEVTSMLDPESKKVILDLIEQLVLLGKTIIQITHFIEEAKLTKRSIILKDGKIIFDGKTKELLSNKKLLEENRLI